MKKQLLLYTFCLIIFILIMMILMMDGSFIHCLQFYVKTGDANNEIHSLLDFDAERDKLVSDKNVFFIETSGIVKEDLLLNARQSCAVESAAKMNPNMNVYLLLVCCSEVSNQTRKFFNQLESYPNVRIRRVYLEKYTRDTPLEKWYEEGAWKKSQWPLEHISDVLRYLTLWKYGGIYLDLDVVVTTCLEDLKNFAGVEGSNSVGAGALGFSGSTLGRRVADICINDLRNNFRVDMWSHNSVGVITRMLTNLCSTNDIRNMTIERCNGFELFPPSFFYPVHYSNWRLYFESQNKKSTMELVKKARAIHVWNKLSVNETVRVDSDVPYAIVARNYCPKIFDNCGELF